MFATIKFHAEQVRIRAFDSCNDATLALLGLLLGSLFNVKLNTNGSLLPISSIRCQIESDVIALLNRVRIPVAIGFRIRQDDFFLVIEKRFNLARLTLGLIVVMMVPIAPILMRLLACQLANDAIVLALGKWVRESKSKFLCNQVQLNA